jgi:hypothetical protein
MKYQSVSHNCLHEKFPIGTSFTVATSIKCTYLQHMSIDKAVSLIAAQNLSIESHNPFDHKRKAEKVKVRIWKPFELDPFFAVHVQYQTDCGVLEWFSNPTDLTRLASSFCCSLADNVGGHRRLRHFSANSILSMRRPRKK